MSNTNEWSKRINSYRYSQDDRSLAYKFSREINDTVNTFLDDPKRRKMLVGTYDTRREPWRLLALAEFRKFGIKIQETIPDPLNPNDVQIVLVKTRLPQYV